MRELEEGKRKRKRGRLLAENIVSVWKVLDVAVYDTKALGLETLEVSSHITTYD